MSFTGDLEHLSIVDVIQLLHATRKSGTLVVQGRKGESQLVFKDGYIVSANHVDNHVRIGNLLVEQQVLTEDQLHLALLDQNVAGADRKPLIAMLIEQGQVKPEEAYRCLEALIELTIVEIIGWRRGTFTLDVEVVIISDEYRYFPEKLNREIYLHTENLLMDALRIYDERVRDGKMPEEEEAEESLPAAAEAAAGGVVPSILTADDLGLGGMDEVTPQKAQFFTTLPDHAPTPRRLPTVASNLPPVIEGALLEFVDAYPAVPLPASCAPVSVILVTSDDFFAHCLSVVCKQEGICVFSTNEPTDIGPIVQQSLARKSLPMLVLDAPLEGAGSLSSELLGRLRQEHRTRFPHLCMVQLVPPGDVSFALQALRDGVRSVMPRPFDAETGDPFLNEMRRLFQAFPSFVKSFGSEQNALAIRNFRSCALALRSLREPPEVSAALLQFASTLFDRTLTLIVRGNELVAERSIGIKGEREGGLSAPVGFRLPLQPASLFQTVIDKGLLFFGATDDPLLSTGLYREIGAPVSTTIMLLPLKVGGKVIALAYGDFGTTDLSAVPVELLEVLAIQAGLVLENALYRKKSELPS